MTKRKKYIQPSCAVCEVEPLSLLNVSTKTVNVNHQKVDNVVGDVNRNEAYDVWDDSWDIRP